MGTITGVIGYGYEDIVIYLAKILSQAGKRIAVVDRTEQELLLEMLGIPERQEEGREVREGEFSGIFLTNQGVDEEVYDIIFLVLGCRLKHPKLYECEKRILVTDGMPVHAAILGKIRQWERKQFLVLRDIVAMKHTERYLARLAGCEGEYDCVFYEEQDARNKYSLGSEAGCGIKYLSKGLKRLLVRLVKYEAPELDEKEVWRVVRRI